MNVEDIELTKLLIQRDRLERIHQTAGKERIEQGINQIIKPLESTYCPTCKKAIDDVLFEYVDYPDQLNLDEVRIACKECNTTVMEM